MALVFMARFTCLVFGADRAVLVLKSLQAPRRDAAVAMAEKVAEDVRDSVGFQLWTGGKIVADRMPHDLAPWRAAPSA